MLNIYTFTFTFELLYSNTNYDNYNSDNPKFWLINYFFGPAFGFFTKNSISPLWIGFILFTLFIYIMYIRIINNDNSKQNFISKLNKHLDNDDRFEKFGISMFIWLFMLSFAIISQINMLKK